MRACARYWERYGQYVFRGREWGGGARTSERVGVQCRAETAWRGGGCSARNLPPIVQLMLEGLIVGIPRTPMHCVFVQEGVCVCVCVCVYVYVWVGVWVCVRGQEEEGRHSATPYTATPYT